MGEGRGGGGALVCGQMLEGGGETGAKFAEVHLLTNPCNCHLVQFLQTDGNFFKLQDMPINKGMFFKDTVGLRRGFQNARNVLDGLRPQNGSDSRSNHLSLEINTRNPHRKRVSIIYYMLDKYYVFLA